LNLEVLIAQVTLHAEFVNGRAQVVSHLALLGVISHAHGDVCVAAQAPDVVGHLEADDEDSAIKFSGSLSKGMSSMVAVERAVLFRIEIGRIVFILAFALTLYVSLIVQLGFY